MNLLRVRHELPPHEKALLATLGWDYEITPDAPECCRFEDGRGPAKMRTGGCRRCKRLAKQKARQ